MLLDERLFENKKDRIAIKDDFRDKLVKTYKGYAHLDDEDDIEIIDEQALASTSCAMGYDVNNLRRVLGEAIEDGKASKRLTEADDMDKLSDKMGDVVSKSMTLNDAAMDRMEDAVEDKAVDMMCYMLDRSLSTSARQVRQGRSMKDLARVNLAFVGEAGVGKTARIMEWAEKRGVNLYTIKASDLQETDLKGLLSKNIEAQKTYRLPTTEFDTLDMPNSVLFVDELNLAPPQVLGSLLTLISQGIIPDASASGIRVLKGFMFTVAAMNPSSYGGTQALIHAMRDRFNVVPIVVDNKLTLNYYNKFLGEELDYLMTEGDEEEIIAAKGRLDIARTLLSDPMFRFDSIEDTQEKEYKQNNDTIIPGDVTGTDAVTSPRTLLSAIEFSLGTKEDFLWAAKGAISPRGYEMCEEILANYVDIADKANQALDVKNRFADEDDIYADESIAAARGELEWMGDQINAYKKNPDALLNDISNKINS